MSKNKPIIMTPAEVDRYTVKAEVEKFDNISASVVIFFSDAAKYGYYKVAVSELGLTDEDIIIKINVVYSDYVLIGAKIKVATVVGFGLDTGIIMQVVDTENTVDHITAMLSEETKDVIKPYMAKAMLLNQ